MIMMAENGRMRMGKVSFVVVLCAVFMLVGWSGVAEGAEPQVSAGWRHTVGLNTDGTVVAVGGNDYGQCDVSGWDLDADQDEDGVPDYVDNCPATYNPGQEDSDADGLGDVCDNCPKIWNPGQADSDNDGLGDLCDWVGDLDNDRDVDFADFALFAADWLKGV